MFKVSKKFILLIIYLIPHAGLLGQGIPHSTGIGIRGGLWTPKNSDGTNIPFGTVGASGFAGSLYFFSRLDGNFFLETSLGGVVADARIGGSSVESKTATPFLFGLRYDLLPSRIESSYQPYLSFGTGVYWMMHTAVGLGVTAKMDAKFGVWGGCGLNIIIKNWFGLNCDIKYHTVGKKDTAIESLNGLELGFGFFFMWGKRREIFRIEEIKVVVKDIYPAYYQFYNTYPLALVSIKNTVNYPIEINIRSEIKGYSERSKESGFERIEPGDTKDVPVYAIFGSKLMQATQREPAVIDLELIAKAGATVKRSVSAQVMIHNRNGWNGEIDKLGFFITPDNEQIMELGRLVTDQISDLGKSERSSFLTAQALFHQLREMGIRYHRDPNILFYQDDRVQFADETVELKTGDCDDLVILFASLLESVGIKTAFVDVHDPEKDVAHVYLMFDTGLSPDQSHMVSSNEKRYVIRETVSGRRSIWIPVETTLLESGFESAWHTGALQYLEEGVLRNGLSAGWVTIIDMR